MTQDTITIQEIELIATKGEELVGLEMASEDLQAREDYPVLQALFAGNAVLDIKTDEENVAAAELLKKIKAAAADISAHRDIEAAPLREYVRQAKTDLQTFENGYNTPLQCLANAEAALKRGVGIFLDARQREQARLLDEDRRRRQQQAMEAAKTREIAVETGDAELFQTADELEAQSAARAPVQTHTKVSGVSLKVTWEAVITDIAKVPDQYIQRTVPAAQMKVLHSIAKAVKKEGPAESIPGVSFVRKTSVASKAAS